MKSEHDHDDDHDHDDSRDYEDRPPLGHSGRPHYAELPIDDLCPGKYVTPCRGPFLHHLHMTELGAMDVTTEDRRFHGYPMLVLAVDLPYVSLRMMANASCPGAILFAYDVRDVSFRAVSDAYVNSLVNGVLDQGSDDSSGGLLSTNPHPAPRDLLEGGAS